MSDHVASLDVHSREYLCSAAFETSSRCNLRCRMCSHPTHSRPVAMMPVEDFKTILGKLSGTKIRNVFFNMGEPLMNKSIFIMIAHARRLGYHVFISTNGQLLGENAAVSVIRTGVAMIKFSIEGFTPDVYASVRRGGDFNLTLENLARLKAIRDQNGDAPRIRISTILMKGNEDIVGFVKFWGRFCDEIEATAITNHIGLADNRDISLSPVWKPRSGCPMVRPYNQINVLSNGDVVICCIDFHARCVLGNLIAQDFEQIWNSETAREVRRKAYAGEMNDLSPCRECYISDYSDILKAGGAHVQDEINVVHEMVKKGMDDTLSHIRTASGESCVRCGKRLCISFSGLCLSCLEKPGERGG